MNEPRTIEEQYTSAGNAEAVDPSLAALIVQFGIGYLVLLQQAAA